MNIMKKIITIYLLLMASIETVFAESGWCGSMVLWNLKDSVLTIKGEGTMNDYSFSWGTCSTPWYNKRASIKTIVVEDGVVGIGNYAFYGCNKVTAVTIGNDVANIGNNVFTGCTALTDVTINSNTIVSKSHQYDNNLCTIFGNQIKEYIIGNGITGIGDYAFYNSSNLISITLPNSITTIGNSSFSGCSSLSSIVIPDGVTSIGSAFYNCISLTSIEIPSSVIFLSNAAFNGCSNLTHVTLNSNSVVNGTNTINSIFAYIHECILGNNVTSIGGCFFDGCNTLISVTISSSITNVGMYAFRGCTNLSEVHISDVGAWCAIQFSNETANPLYYAHNLYIGEEILTDLIIPDTVTLVSAEAFAYCNSITSLTIPKNVATVGTRAFNNCNNLARVTINSNSVMSSGGIKDKFGANVSEYIIGDSVITIGNSAFSNCTGMTSVTIGNSVSNIANSAFANCTGLNEVHISDIAAWCDIAFGNLLANPLYTAHNLYLNDDMVSDLIIPENVTSIGNYAFNGCTCMESLLVPKNITNIGNSVFDNCNNLMSIVWCPETLNDYSSASNAPFYNIRNQINSFIFGAEVRNIPAFLCYGMNNIPSIIFPNSVKNIGKNAFDGCSSIDSLMIDSNIQNIGWGAFIHCSNLSVLTLNSNSITNKTYTDEGNLCNIFGKQVLKCSIGDSVTNIGDFAFFDCYSLTELKIGKNLGCIGNWTFYDCNLTTIFLNSNAIVSHLNFEDSFGQLQSRKVQTVIIGDDVTTIGHHFFSGCEYIKSIQISENVTNIEQYAFMSCFALQSVNIPQNVTHISEGTFDDCRNLTSIILPSGVTSIGNFAFAGCSGLQSITSKATTPPTIIGNNVFTPVDKTIPLFVPAESIDLYKSANGWRDFTNIFALSATIANVTSINVEPSDNNAMIYWPSFNNASVYTIEIRKNGNLLYTLSFDDNGQLLTNQFSMPAHVKSRKVNTTEVTGWKYNIPGLEANSSYDFICTVEDGLENVIFNQTISFTTNNIASALDNITEKSAYIKQVRNGQILILRGDKTYTLQGQEVK